MLTKLVESWKSIREAGVSRLRSERGNVLAFTVVGILALMIVVSHLMGWIPLLRGLEARSDQLLTVRSALGSTAEFMRKLISNRVCVDAGTFVQVACPDTLATWATEDSTLYNFGRMLLTDDLRRSLNAQLGRPADDYRILLGSANSPFRDRRLDLSLVTESHPMFAAFEQLREMPQIEAISLTVEQIGNNRYPGTGAERFLKMKVKIIPKAIVSSGLDMLTSYNDLSSEMIFGAFPRKVGNYALVVDRLRLDIPPGDAQQGTYDFAVRPLAKGSEVTFAAGSNAPLAVSTGQPLPGLTVSSLYTNDIVLPDPDGSLYSPVTLNNVTLGSGGLRVSRGGAVEDYAPPSPGGDDSRLSHATQTWGGIRGGKGLKRDFYGDPINAVFGGTVGVDMDVQATCLDRDFVFYAVEGTQGTEMAGLVRSSTLLPATDGREEVYRLEWSRRSDKRYPNFFTEQPNLSSGVIAGSYEDGTADAKVNIDGTNYDFQTIGRDILKSANVTTTGGQRPSLRVDIKIQKSGAIVARVKGEMSLQSAMVIKFAALDVDQISKPFKDAYENAEANKAAEISKLHQLEDDYRDARRDLKNRRVSYDDELDDLLDDINTNTPDGDAAKNAVESAFKGTYKTLRQDENNSYTESESYAVDEEEEGPGKLDALVQSLIALDGTDITITNGGAVPQYNSDLNRRNSAKTSRNNAKTAYYDQKAIVDALDNGTLLARWDTAKAVQQRYEFLRGKEATVTVSTTPFTIGSDLQRRAVDFHVTSADENFLLNHFFDEIRVEIDKGYDIGTTGSGGDVTARLAHPIDTSYGQLSFGVVGDLFSTPMVNRTIVPPTSWSGYKFLDPAAISAGKSLDTFMSATFNEEFYKTACNPTAGVDYAVPSILIEFSRQCRGSAEGTTTCSTQYNLAPMSWNFKPASSVVFNASNAGLGYFTGGDPVEIGSVVDNCYFNAGAKLAFYQLVCKNVHFDNDAPFIGVGTIIAQKSVTFSKRALENGVTLVSQMDPLGIHYMEATRRLGAFNVAGTTFRTCDQLRGPGGILGWASNLALESRALVMGCNVSNRYPAQPFEWPMAGYPDCGYLIRGDGSITPNTVCKEDLMKLPELGTISERYTF